jgi:hypothetical protein
MDTMTKVEVLFILWFFVIWGWARILKFPPKG